MQTVIGTLMFYIANHVQVLLDSVRSYDGEFERWRVLTHPLQPAENIHLLTLIFVSLVFFSATQGIHQSQSQRL